MKQKTHLADRRAAIMQAALACFIEHGFHATSMRDIALASSVSLGNLYNHFSSKQALIAEVATQEQVELAPLRRTLEQADTPSIKQVQKFLTAYWKLCRQREWAILSIECLSEISRSPELMPAFENNRRHLLNTLANAIDRATVKGVFRPAGPTRLVAQALLDITESDALRQALTAQAGAFSNQGDFALQEMDDASHLGLLRGLLGT